MKKALLAIVASAFAHSALAGVSGTPHDLTVNSAKYGAPAAAYTGLTPCNFCHAVHRSNNSFAGAPLWNRQNLPAAAWTMYDQTSLTGGSVDATPNAASLTCLACHEGSAALGALFSTGGTNVLTGGTMTAIDPIASRNFVIGRDLSNDHPVSFPYVGIGGNSFPSITSSGTAAANVSGLPLYGASFNRMECATCHDPHNNDNGRFLRQPSAGICAVCHVDK